MRGSATSSAELDLPRHGRVVRIGADIARELAQWGHGRMLSARREDRLRELATDLEESGPLLAALRRFYPVK